MFDGCEIQQFLRGLVEIWYFCHLFSELLLYIVVCQQYVFLLGERVTVEIRRGQASCSEGSAVIRPVFSPEKAVDFVRSGHLARPGIASIIAPRDPAKCIRETSP